MVGHDGISTNGLGRESEGDVVVAVPRPSEDRSPQNGRPAECSPQQQVLNADGSFTSPGDETGHAPIRNTSGVAFWNVHIPQSDWTDECPEYLQYAFKDHKDRGVLSTPDTEYQRQSWDAVRELIRGNRLDMFKRVPSQLRLYREYCQQLIRKHGSIMNFVLKERLHWEDLDSSASLPFSNADDYIILYNDWPYGVDERIVHLVVWTKFELPADPASKIGDMSTTTRAFVNDFVEKTFVSTCGRENVRWFKNWNSLKSIHAVEHFHVMLYDPDAEFVRRVTHGDRPLFEKVISSHAS